MRGRPGGWGGGHIRTGPILGEFTALFKFLELLCQLRSWSGYSTEPHFWHLSSLPPENTRNLRSLRNVQDTKCWQITECTNVVLVPVALTSTYPWFKPVRKAILHTKGNFEENTRLKSTLFITNYKIFNRGLFTTVISGIYFAILKTLNKNSSVGTVTMLRDGEPELDMQQGNEVPLFVPRPDHLRSSQPPAQRVSGMLTWCQLLS